MKQKLIKIIWIILVLLVVIICITTMGNVSAINPNSERIAELSFQLNELESQKYICLDNLSYKETESQIKWFSKYCVEYDEQIMEIQAQIDELKEWKAESETETAWTAEVWTPWQLTEDWDHQEMPPIEADTPHDRFKKLCEAYWLDASVIWNIENHYWLTEWLVACITVAETSWANRWYGKTNPWNVGNNDRWDRVQYALIETWLEKIGQTLTNKYLWKTQTLWCLSNAGSCRENITSRYATSEHNREANMTACLSTIYWKIDPATFNIRQR